MIWLRYHDSGRTAHVVKSCVVKLTLIMQLSLIFFFLFFILKDTWRKAGTKDYTQTHPFTESRRQADQHVRLRHY